MHLLLVKKWPLKFLNKAIQYMKFAALCGERLMDCNRLPQYWLRSSVHLSLRTLNFGMKFIELLRFMINLDHVTNVTGSTTPLTRACRSELMCISCAQSHPEACDPSALRCINCKGSHAANDKNCPAYQREIKLQKFRSQHHLTIRDARRQFKDSNIPLDHSYAKVASHVPQEYVSKSDFESTMQNMVSQFSSLVQTMVAEVQRSTFEMVESITKSLLAIIQDNQAKKLNKTQISALTEELSQKAKKLKVYNFNTQEHANQMDFQEVTSQVSNSEGPPNVLPSRTSS